MLVYVIVASVLFLGVIAKQSRYLYWIGLLCLFFLTAFRNPVLGGSDTLIYQDFFADVPGFLNLAGYDSKYSIGYTFLNSFVKQFTDDFMIFQFVYAVITFFLLACILRNLKLNYKERCLFLLSYFVFRFIWSEWIILRQNLSDLLFWLILLEIYGLLDKRRENVHWYYLKILLLLICSIAIPALFHTSAYFNIAVLPLLLVFRNFSLKDKFIITAVICVVCLVGSQILFGYFFNFASLFDSRYEMYAGNEDSMQNIINTAVKYAFFALFVWHYKSEKYGNKKFLIDTMAVTCMLASINVEIIMRMYEYYAVGFYSIMSLFLNNFANKRMLMACLFFVGLMIILLRFLLIFGDGMFSQYTLGF